LVEGGQLNGKNRASATEMWFGWKDAGRVGIMETVQLGAVEGGGRREGADPGFVFGGEGESWK